MIPSHEPWSIVFATTARGGPAETVGGRGESLTAANVSIYTQSQDTKCQIVVD